jgi:hypothetical protein
MQKHVNAKKYLLLVLFFMPPRYGVHGALKNAKAENFYDFLNAGIGK